MGLISRVSSRTYRETRNEQIEILTVQLQNMHKSTVAANAYKHIYRASSKSSVKILKTADYKRTKANWPDITLNEIERPDWRLSLPGNVGIIDDQQKDAPAKFDVDGFLSSCKEMYLSNQLSETKLYNVENISLPERTEAAVADCITKTEIHPRPTDFPIFDFKNKKHLIDEFVENKNASASVEKCPVLLKDKLASVMFGTTHARYKENLTTVITLNFMTENDQSVYSENMTTERKQIIDNFIELAKYISFSLVDNNHYADFINPYTGKSWINESHVDYLSPTDDALNELENLKIIDIGCCKIMSHCNFNTNVFTGILVTNVKPDHWFLKKLLEKDF